MKSHEVGYWYEGSQNITNVNILSSVTKEDLVQLTSDGVCTLDHLSSHQIYLAWPDIKWKLHGRTSAMNVPPEDFCSASENSVVVLFPG